MSDSEDHQNDRERDRGRRDRGNRGGGNNFRDRSRDRGSGRDPKSMKPSQTRVYVSNIPYEYRWQDVKDLFRNEVGEVQFVEMFVNEFDKPKGCGIVEFADPASVKKCMEVMQRFEVKTRKLVVKEDNGVMRDKHGAIIRRGDRSFDRRGGGDSNMSIRNDDGNWGNTYGLSASFLESLNIDPPLINKVFVANLDYGVDKKKLKDAFRLAGKIVNVDLPIDKEGRIRGFAVVEYDHPVEAVQAISMFHGQPFFDRNITVKMDRANDTYRLPEGLRSIGMGLGPNGEPLKCVAHNLPSLAQQSGGDSNGLLGAVPGNSLPLNALSGLGNIGALNALQAANLSGILGNSDLSSLVTNQLAANSAAQQQLAALASQNTSSNSFGRGGGGGGAVSSDDFENRSNKTRYPLDIQSGDYGNSSNNGNFQAKDYDRFNFSENTNGKSFSRKVHISNLPSTVSYKLLNEKCSEFGDVQAFEPKGAGSVLLTYASDWQAEKAIKNLDKARIDGRMIDARLYF